jgi:hypothetical protein
MKTIRIDILVVDPSSVEEFYPGQRPKWTRWNFSDEQYRDVGVYLTVSAEGVFIRDCKLASPDDVDLIMDVVDSLPHTEDRGVGEISALQAWQGTADWLKSEIRASLNNAISSLAQRKRELEELGE